VKPKPRIHATFPLSLIGFSKERKAAAMQRIMVAILVAFTVHMGMDEESWAQGENSSARRMARYNVVWTNASKNASGAMPIGNGDIAASVYAIENGDLYLLLAKNDAFNYCGDLYKTGRVRISMTPNPFAAGKPFRQTLDLSTGSIQIEADGVKLRIWVDANRPIYHVEIDSPQEFKLIAQPDLWKRYVGTKEDMTQDIRSERGNRLIWYYAVGDRSCYHERLKNTSQGLWKIENPGKIVPDFYRFNTFGNLVEMYSGVRSQKSGVTDGKLIGKGKQFDIRIHSLTMQAPDTNVWIQAVEELVAKPVDLKNDWEQHCDWWRRFWERGWIIASDRTVPESDRERFHGEASGKGEPGPCWKNGRRLETDGAALVAQSYNMFRFYMGSQSRGRFQTKFNGGLFTQQMRVFRKPGEKPGHPGVVSLGDGSWLTHEDSRAWGAFFTSQNQRLLYWPLLMGGDFDLMKPFFDHYWNVLEMRKAITKAYFGHGGAYYRENVNPVTGDDEWGPPPKVKAGEPYKGGWLTFHFTSGLEVATMMADYVNYTGDGTFRDDRLVPFAREILLFYDQHYPRDDKGKLRLEPSQALETWWYTVNPAPDVAGLRFCLDQLLAMKAGTDEDQATWKRFRAEIPEVPLRMIDGRQAVAPAAKHEAKKVNQELPEIYPIFPFRCYGLAQGSQELAEWTMRHRDSPDTFGGTCWTQDQIGWALAGRATESAQGLVKRFRIASVACRFPLFGNEWTDGMPDLDHFGSGSIALQRMLVQEGGDKIHLLPAWPAEWDVDFKLHLQGGVVLTGTVKDGKLEKWDITPASRKADVVVHEPQEGKTVR
jgi:hypothetical protein